MKMLHQLRCSTQDVVVHSFRELKARWALRNWRSPTGIMVFGVGWTVTVRVEQISLLLPERIPELYQSLYKAGDVLPPPRGGRGALLNAVWPKGTRAPAAPASPVTSNQQPLRRFSRTKAQVKHGQLPPRSPEACNSLSLQGLRLGVWRQKEKSTSSFANLFSEPSYYFFGTHLEPTGGKF